MKEVDGWTCPDLLSGPGNYLGRCPHNDVGLALLRNRRVAIQAGGHIGTVPVYLAGRFETVYTFEPDGENFAALVDNCHRRYPASIFCARGVLGWERGCVDMLTSLKSTGQHRIRKGAGIVPSFRIDDLALSRVDAILLDVEGCEINALMGSLDTLRRCRPIVIAEENKRALDQGHKIGDLERFLVGVDYVRRAQVADDIVFAHRKAA